MTDEKQELDENELEAEANGAEELPDREAMSIVTPVGDSLGAPPLAD